MLIWFSYAQRRIRIPPIRRDPTKPSGTTVRLTRQSDRSRTTRRNRPAGQFKRPRQNTNYPDQSWPNSIDPTKPSEQTIRPNHLITNYAEECSKLQERERTEMWDAENKTDKHPCNCTEHSHVCSVCIVSCNRQNAEWNWCLPPTSR
jgi:hypothetical protein